MKASEIQAVYMLDLPTGLDALTRTQRQTVAAELL